MMAILCPARHNSQIVNSQLGSETREIQICSELAFTRQRFCKGSFTCDPYHSALHNFAYSRMFRCEIGEMRGSLMSGKGLRLFILLVFLVGLVGLAVAGPKKGQRN